MYEPRTLSFLGVQDGVSVDVVFSAQSPSDEKTDLQVKKIVKNVEKPPIIPQKIVLPEKKQPTTQPAAKVVKKNKPTADKPVKKTVHTKKEVKPQKKVFKEKKKVKVENKEKPVPDKKIDNLIKKVTKKPEKKTTKLKATSVAKPHANFDPSKIADAIAGAKKPKSANKQSSGPTNAQSTSVTKLLAVGQKASNNVPSSKVGQNSIPLGSRLTAGELDAFRQQVRACWNPVSQDSKVSVVVAFQLTKSGHVLNNQVQQISSQGGDAFGAFGRARRAVLQCQPYTKLPAHKYMAWRMVEIRFSANQLSFE